MSGPVAGAPGPRLRYELRVAPEATAGSPALVLLHGRGSHRKDLLILGERLPDDVLLVTPEAPHPGRPWGYGPGWAWYRYLGGDRLDRDSLDASLEALHAFLSALDEILPVRPGTVVLGGFSQGGTTSIAYALRHPGRVAGVINLSGFLADGLLEDAAPSSPRGLAVFWGHGTRDPNIPHAMGVEGRRRLTEAGADVTARDYAIGHRIAPQELADVIAWLEGLPSA